MWLFHYSQFYMFLSLFILFASPLSAYYLLIINFMDLLQKNWCKQKLQCIKSANFCGVWKLFASFFFPSSFVRSRGKQMMRDESFTAAAIDGATSQSTQQQQQQLWEFVSKPTINNSVDAVCVCVSVGMKDIISFKLIALIMILRIAHSLYGMRMKEHNSLAISMCTEREREKRRKKLMWFFFFFTFVCRCLCARTCVTITIGHQLPHSSAQFAQPNNLFNLVCVWYGNRFAGWIQRISVHLDNWYLFFLLVSVGPHIGRVVN